ncbi:hypothetical protein KKG81_07360 [bacterium]|nr:hypothetical protein [bacterium]
MEEQGKWWNDFGITEKIKKELENYKRMKGDRCPKDMPFIGAEPTKDKCFICKKEIDGLIKRMAICEECYNEQIDKRYGKKF